MLREENWTYGVVEEDKPKLQPLLDALRRLLQHGMTAPALARRDEAGGITRGESDVARVPPP
jgi:hypothetical protein